ncbi:nSTAND1 domain-containing NTPase [Agromyces humatus]|uniref:OmpR/PhoB-type domain-containing protein n=1 Tax=Agromyces humatus TaxID=279573 RepID=A0ABN2KTJ0_9MICO|nr:BTAD domain-containing putative transcriptional regulator [Agromyces humatus]
MGIRVLGAVEIDEGPLSPRARAVLSVLVLCRGEPVAPAVIADAVWGEHPPATWPKQVQTTMVGLRASLGRSSIATSSIGYVLDVDPEAIDAVRFERLAQAAAELRSRGDPQRAVDDGRRALALWRGPAYGAISSWEPAVIESARLEEVRSTAEEELAAAHLDCGEQHSVIAGAEALVREQPLRERRWSLLATALYRSGRQADALATLRAARVRFADELGIEPGPELSALEAAILHQDPSLLPPPRSPQPSADCPYKGLHPYGIDDGEEFFGRDADIAAILARLDRAPFIAVSGPSGCGKSSLVLAGVVPALARRGLAVQVVSPSPTIAAQLRDALYSRRSADVVVVDQLEELFHVGFPPDEVHGVGELIAEAASSRIVVATVRSDFLDECSAEPSLAGLLSESVQLVGAMDKQDLRAAIEQPALRAGLRLEAGLTELILRDASGHSTALPLLSHALVETWLRREASVLTVAGYEEVGGLTGAIARTAEHLFDELTPTQRDVCRSTMLRLVELGPDGRPMRRYAKRSSLNEDAVRAAVVARLIHARLLSASDDTVAVTHELLAFAWPRLHDWLEEDAAGARLLGKLTLAADAWEADGEREDDLYRGARLQNALDWRSTSKPDLTSTESRFLDAAEQRARREEAEARLQLQRDRRQNRRLRVLFGATAALLGLSLLASVLVVGATQEADRQREAAVVEATVSTSFALRGSERDVAALIAAEAYRRWPDDPRTRSALLGVFTAAQGFLGSRYVSGTDSIAGAVIGDTGQAVIVRDDESAAVVDMGSGRSVRELDIGAPPGGFGPPPLVRVSADGRLAAILRPIDSPTDFTGIPDSGPDETSQFLLVDLTANRTRLGPVALDLGVGALALSPDGRHVAVADSRFEGQLGVVTVATIDLESGEFRRIEGIHQSAQPFSRSVALVFTPDGRLVVGTGATQLSVIDPDSVGIVASIRVPRASANAAMAATSDGRLIASGDDALVAVDLTSGDLLWSQEFATAQPAPCPWLTVAQSRSTVFCGDLWGRIEERSLDTGLPTGRHLDPQLGAVGPLTVSPNGDELVAIGAGSSAISRWRLDGSGAITRMIAHGQVATGGYDPSGTLILVAERAPWATEWSDLTQHSVWDPRTDATRLRVPGVGGFVDWVDTDVLHGVIPGYTGTGYFDASTGAHLEGDPVPWPLNVLFRDSGRRIYLADGTGAITPVDPGTRRHLEPEMHFDGVTVAISASTDGATLAVTTVKDGVCTTRLVDAATGTAISRELIGPELTVLARPGELIAADDNRLLRYSVPDLDPIDALPGVKGGLASLQVSDDRRTLVAGANDDTVTLYDLVAGIRLGDPIPSESPQITPGYLRPDGRELLVNMRDGVAVWDLDPDAQLRAACRLAGRDLTREEWATHFGAIAPYRETCG